MTFSLKTAEIYYRIYTSGFDKIQRQLLTKVDLLNIFSPLKLLIIRWKFSLLIFISFIEILDEENGWKHVVNDHLHSEMKYGRRGQYGGDWRQGRTNNYVFEYWLERHFYLFFFQCWRDTQHFNIFVYVSRQTDLQQSKISDLKQMTSLWIVTKELRKA